MPNVYIVNNAGHPYESAKEHGELVFLTSGHIDIYKEFTFLKRKLENLIKEASPDDYLLLSGSNLLCVIAENIWLKFHKKCNILHWNPNYGAKRYDLYTLE